MKCVMCLSGSAPEYEEMAKVAVRSALASTSLEVVLVYDGKSAALRSWMRNHGIHVIDWTVSFLDDLSLRYDGKKSIEFCRGTYLCMEVPRIMSEYGFEDEYILYTDLDVLFVGEVCIQNLEPEYFCAPKDWSLTDNSRFSTGIVLMNLKTLQNTYPDFVQHLKSNDYNFEHADMGPCDQGAWNTFYINVHEELPAIYDWKPWWGKNEDARIIHFSGPKPRHVRRLIEQHAFSTDDDEIHKYVVDQNPDAFIEYVEQWEGITNME